MKRSTRARSILAAYGFARRVARLVDADRHSVEAHADAFVLTLAWPKLDRHLRVAVPFWQLAPGVIERTQRGLVSRISQGPPQTAELPPTAAPDEPQRTGGLGAGVPAADESGPPAAEENCQ
jgi:hypothetical protein